MSTPDTRTTPAKNLTGARTRPAGRNGAGRLGLNLGGWGIFAFAIPPHHFHYKGLGIGLGVAVTAWTLGARHAFDADHISAIDNTTRKLMANGKRPLATGFFFALGHSTIILVVGVGISVAAREVFGAMVDPNSSYRERRRRPRHRRVRRLPLSHRHIEPGGTGRHRQGVP